VSPKERDPGRNLERDCFDAEVAACRPSGRDGFLLTARLARPLARPLEGGHFFMLRTGGADFPFLNRPFSVHDVRENPVGGPELDFLFKSIGRGTGCMARARRGDPLRLIGPLGRPFPSPRHGETTLLVAGGVGLPPLFLHLRRRQQRPAEEGGAGAGGPVILLYGARSKDQLFELAAAEKLGVPVKTATEDGSLGLHGRVDRLLDQTLVGLGETPVRILTCGPDPMMAAVAALARSRKVPCLVSLETLMACGFGVCNACAVPIDDGKGGVARFARACIDGPVVDGAEVLWHAAAH
jgi:dihydroorotate dehydrogenase electron transfer subunit